MHSAKVVGRPARSYDLWDASRREFDPNRRSEAISLGRLAVTKTIQARLRQGRQGCKKKATRLDMVSRALGAARSHVPSRSSVQSNNKTRASLQSYAYQEPARPGDAQMSITPNDWPLRCYEPSRIVAASTSQRSTSYFLQRYGALGRFEPSHDRSPHFTPSFILLISG